MVNKGNHPRMALIQVSEILKFTQIHTYIYIYIYMGQSEHVSQGMTIMLHVPFKTQVWGYTTFSNTIQIYPNIIISSMLVMYLRFSGFIIYNGL